MNITGFLNCCRGIELREGIDDCLPQDAWNPRATCDVRVLPCDQLLPAVRVVRWRVGLSTAGPNDASSARFSSSTLTRARPRNPKVGGSVCASTSSRTRCERGAARRCDAARLQVGRGRRDMRVETRAAGCHHLRRNLPRSGPFLCRDRLQAAPARPSGDRDSRARSSCRRSTRRCSRHPTGAAWKYSGLVNFCAMSRDPTIVPSSRRMRLPSACDGNAMRPTAHRTTW